VTDDLERRFGPHGGLVSAFLEEITIRSTDWPAVSQRMWGEETLAAVGAISAVRWPAAQLGAIDNAGLRAYSALGISRGTFSDPLIALNVKSGIGSALKAIAAGGKLAAEHRRVLLVPFVEAGFVSAAEALRVLDGFEVPGGDVSDSGGQGPEGSQGGVENT
jgi:hypothetical protein